MKYAYATFLMRGDGYLPGALVLAYALKLQTNYDCICLVTDDVSLRARLALGLVYDKVIEINELRIKSGVGIGRSDRNVLMTRFEALKLGADGGLGCMYDKIVLLDADVLPVSGYDELFQLQAPAGILMERKEESYSPASNPTTFSRDTHCASEDLPQRQASAANGCPNEVFQAPSHESNLTHTGHWSWHDLYNPICPHGAGIPKELTDRVRRDISNMGVNAGLWVLQPSMEEYGAVLVALNSSEVTPLIKAFPWPEMQLATLLWSGRWTNIDIRYCSIGGYPRPDVLYGMHFAGLKPWQFNNRSAMHYANFPDFTLWRQYCAALYWSIPQLREYPALQRLWEFCKKAGI